MPRDSYLYPKITKILFSIIVLSAYLAKKFDVLIVTDSSKVADFGSMIMLVPPAMSHCQTKPKVSLTFQALSLCSLPCELNNFTYNLSS